jgi:sulfonate transport system substrate-binding protein
MGAETGVISTRRSALALGLGLATAGLLAACGQPADKGLRFRIGYQKNGLLLVTKTRGTIEARMKAVGVDRVEWIEFASGPPLLEALAVGSIDFGSTGDAPPVFAQAAGADLLYVAAMPISGKGAAILVPKTSTAKSVADLKGKKIAFTKGTSAQNFAEVALKAAGLSVTDVEVANLSPADGAAAFAKGALDAWVIWDPYYALAERDQGARVLLTAEGVTASSSFFLARRAFAEANPTVISAALDEMVVSAAWSAANVDEVAKIMADATGIDQSIQKIAALRESLNIAPLSETVLANQQALADRLYASKAIPKKVVIGAAVWKTSWAPKQ